MAPAAHRAALEQAPDPRLAAAAAQLAVAALAAEPGLTAPCSRAARQVLYAAAGWRLARCPVPVLVVGNLVAGGAGKTPVLLTLVRHLQARGLRVGVVSRGHGRHSSGCRQVQADSPAREVGDEPCADPAQYRRAGGGGGTPRRGRRSPARAPPHDPADLVRRRPAAPARCTATSEVCVFDDRGAGQRLFCCRPVPLRERSGPAPASHLVLHNAAPSSTPSPAIRRAAQLARLARLRADWYLRRR